MERKKRERAVEEGFKVREGGMHRSCQAALSLVSPAVGAGKINIIYFRASIFINM